MAKPRASTSRRAAQRVRPGSINYLKAGREEIVPAYRSIKCPGCTGRANYSKNSGNYHCYRCGARFTKAQAYRAAEAQAKFEWKMRQDELKERARKRSEDQKIRSEGATAVVYYIRFRDAVKVGTSTNVGERLRNHPWEELIGIEPGGLKVEARRHNQFREARLDNEWFEITESVRGQIDRINQDNADWYQQTFGTMGPLPVAKKDARFPDLSDYPPAW